MTANRANHRDKHRGLRDLQWAQSLALGLSLGLTRVFARRRRTDRTSIEQRSADAMFLKPPAAAFAGAFLGCLTTLYLGEFGIASAIASALATTLLCGQVLAARAAGLLPVEFFAAVYGGSFGGMTPVLWLGGNGPEPSFISASALFMALSIFCGIAFGVVAEIDACSRRRLGLGYGGRSGAIATLASLVFIELASLLGADGGVFRAARAALSDVDPASTALICAACTIGTFATLLALRQHSVATASPADRTFIASTVALIGLLTIDLSDHNDARILDAFYAGCFLGMSTPERLKGWFQPLLGAIVLTGMLIAVRALLPGVGGSLGFAAFASVAVVAAVSPMTTWLTPDMPMRDARRSSEPMSSKPVSSKPVSSKPISSKPTSPEPALPKPAWSRPGSRSASSKAPPSGISSSDAFVLRVIPRAITVAVVALVTVAGVALALQRLSKPAAIDAAESRVQQPAPASRLVLVQAKPGTADAAALPGTPRLEVDHADLRTVTELPARADARGPSASDEARGPVYEPTEPAVHPLAESAAAAADAGSRAAADHAVRSDPIAPVLRATSDGAASSVEPARSAGPVGEAMDSHEKMFREFLQWRAAHPRGLVQSGVQAARRSRNHQAQAVGLLTASGSQPRAGLQAVATSHLRRPAHNFWQSPAPDRSRP